MVIERAGHVFSIHTSIKSILRCLTPCVHTGVFHIATFFVRLEQWLCDPQRYWFILVYLWFLLPLPVQIQKKAEKWLKIGWKGYEGVDFHYTNHMPQNILQWSLHLGHSSCNIFRKENRTFWLFRLVIKIVQFLNNWTKSANMKHPSTHTHIHLILRIKGIQYSSIVRISNLHAVLNLHCKSIWIFILIIRWILFDLKKSNAKHTILKFLQHFCWYRKLSRKLPGLGMNKYRLITLGSSINYVTMKIGKVA